VRAEAPSFGTRGTERSPCPTPDQQQLIARGALAWLRLLDHPDILIRLDIVEIVLSDTGPAFNLPETPSSCRSHILGCP